MIFEDNSVSKEALQEDFNAQYWEDEKRSKIIEIKKQMEQDSQRERRGKETTRDASNFNKIGELNFT